MKKQIITGRYTPNHFYFFGIFDLNNEILTRKSAKAALSRNKKEACQ